MNLSFVIKSFLITPQNLLYGRKLEMEVVRETRAQLGFELCKREVPGAGSEQTGVRDNMEIMGLCGRILFFPLFQKTKHTLLINLRSSILCYLKAAVV